MPTNFKLLLLSAVLLAACHQQKEDDDLTSLDRRLTQALTGAAGANGLDYFRLPSSTDLASIPQDPNNPLTEDKVALGQALFHETALGLSPMMEIGKQTYSCASCHHAGAGFQAGIRQGIGDGGSGYGYAGEGRVPNAFYAETDLDVQPIRTPSAMNGAFQKLMLWNGQFGATGDNMGTEDRWTPGTPLETNALGYEGLETQAIAGLSVHRMEIDMDVLAPFGYQELFDAAFPDFSPTDRYSKETAGLAIAAFERTVLANEAPFQRWLRGEHSAMSNYEKLGAIVFFKKGNCVTCHTGPALNSMDFHALGMNDLQGDGVHGVSTQAVGDAGKGRGSFTGEVSDMYKFKVPQLYNLANSPFYGHGGSFTSIRDVVEYKNSAIPENAVVPQSQLADGFAPLHLNQHEVYNLIEFLQGGLFDDNLSRYEPDVLPSGMCFPNADDQSRADLGCEPSSSR